MPRRKKLELESAIQEKLDYIGLDLQKVPASITKYEELNYKIIKNYDEKQYKQYRFVNISDIQILFSNTNRLNTVKEKYENARPIAYYLDYKNQENLEYYTTFLSMLKKVEIYEIDKIEEEQKRLSKKIPFKVKYEGNYLWQIYYSEYDDKYFMIVPTEDSDYSTLFYLLKKKLENNKDEKIFVPVSYVDYSSNILRKSEIKDLENYLWLFTRDYPMIYEVYDKKDNASIQIVGETEIYGKIKTLYKVILNSSKDANKFYKIVKALFIIQSELPNYFEFQTNIDEKGILGFYLNNAKIEYESLPEFIVEQYLRSISLKEQNNNDLCELKNKIQKLKTEGERLEADYIAKEKQISTYLECKKTFFGKVKFFFKSGKKKEKIHPQKIILEDRMNRVKNEDIRKEKVKLSVKNYTLEELLESYRELEQKETEKKNVIMDINALKLKNKNLKRKLFNATAYVDEINKHKRSIFEFWKYSNKDEVASLDEGEEEENITKDMEKTFNYDDDFETFGNRADKLQRKYLTDDELESAFIATTDLFDLLNRIDKNEAPNKEIADALKKIKQEKEEQMQEETEESFDIFGKLNSIIDSEKTIGNRVHREVERNKYDILAIKKGLRGIEFKRLLDDVIDKIKSAINKITLDNQIYVYKATNFELELDRMQRLSLNVKEELANCLNEKKSKDDIYLYKIKLNKNTNFLAFSNIIFYNNKNMTLPLGMNLSSEILVDLGNLKLNKVGEKTLHKLKFDDEENDFSDMKVKTIKVIELE